MTSYLLSIMPQSDTGSDWNWLLIFIVFVVILAVALIIQARFSAQEAGELAHETHHDEDELSPSAADVPETEAKPESEPAIQADLVSEAPAPEVQVEFDDLKRIEGIGPKVAGLLGEKGITTFSKLAETSAETLNEILEAAQLQMMDPASWPQQARLAANGEWEALQRLQDELKGGR